MLHDTKLIIDLNNYLNKNMTIIKIEISNLIRWCFIFIFPYNLSPLFIAEKCSNSNPKIKVANVNLPKIVSFIEFIIISSPPIIIVKLDNNVIFFPLNCSKPAKIVNPP